MKHVQLLISAYIDLLKIQHDSTRIRIEPLFCKLRDEISRLTGKDIETVQTECEQIALAERLLSM